MSGGLLVSLKTMFQKHGCQTKVMETYKNPVIACDYS